MHARRLLGADAAAWKVLRLEALATYPKAFLTTYAEAEALPVAQIADRLDAGQTFGAFADDALVGIASLIPQKRSQVLHRADVGAVYVRPAAQGTGAADALIRTMLGAGQEFGIWQYELFVAEDNARAIAFYTRHGFEQVGRMPNATFGPDGPVHDLLMVRSVAPA